ncbi:MAG: MarC family protein [Cycloclasticus sp.]|jgi:multiple antibiotic resistance protein|nr:MarC family protein [Cycloclasticus sp.]|tara:strand:- start:92341 stop:92946 length:606 start_codon:yes stop_codon:yes gene_type:complete
MELIKASTILFVLLNPFLISIYLISLIRDLSLGEFMKVMIRAHLISGIVFIIFALTGEGVFENVFNVRFGAFLIFGGIIFLWIGIQSIFSGKVVLIDTSGKPEHIVGSVAMPFMIAPGTISASVLIGSSLPAPSAAIAIAVAISFSLVSIIVFKLIHDPLKKHHERLLNRYVEVVGRVVALFTGTYAIEMIARGLILLWPK